jgi:hypothetical protein
MNRCTRAQRRRRMHWHFCLCRRPKPTDELEHNQPREGSHTPSCSLVAALSAAHWLCALLTAHGMRTPKSEPQSEHVYISVHAQATHMAQPQGTWGTWTWRELRQGRLPHTFPTRVHAYIYGMPLQSQGIAARLGRPRSNRQHKRRGIRSAALLAPDALRRPLRVFRRVGSHPKRLPQGRVLDVALPKLFA